jgi:glucan phosphoethanolaminetransferase (alkaline phosphatase superfamily)
MIAQFVKLNREEQELLLRAPVLVSVLASCSYKNVNQKQKADAIKLAHLKTFTAVPILLPYYQEVEKIFRDEFEATIHQYFPFDEVQVRSLEKELQKVHQVMTKIDKDYAMTLSKSLDKYAAHVKRADHSIFQDFLFAFSIPGLSA